MGGGEAKTDHPENQVTAVKRGSMVKRISGHQQPTQDQRSREDGSMVKRISGHQQSTQDQRSREDGSMVKRISGPQQSTQDQRSREDHLCTGFLHAKRFNPNFINFQTSNTSFNRKFVSQKLNSTPIMHVHHSLPSLDVKLLLFHDCNLHIIITVKV